MKILVCFKITKTIIIFLNDRNYYISGIMLYIYVILTHQFGKFSGVCIIINIALIVQN